MQRAPPSGSIGRVARIHPEQVHTPFTHILIVMGNLQSTSMSLYYGRKATQTRGEHADSTQKGPGIRTLLAVRRQCYPLHHHAAQRVHGHIITRNSPIRQSINFYIELFTPRCSPSAEQLRLIQTK
uniref:Uncharacterized protein n=1 Tax=Anguilla anguilla TaxID=7936 RepID=A0A0E9WLA5_ANGAN